METTVGREPARGSYTLSQLQRPDGARIAVYAWPLPRHPKGVVQIAHGLAEHAARYDRLARALVDAGYAVYASDHRGHGKSVADPSELGFFAREHGFDVLIEDLYAVNRYVAGRHGDLPRVLLGHSFGSFVTQGYLLAHADSVSAVALSGTTSGQTPLLLAGIATAHAERARLGPRATSKLLQQLSFGSYNRAFEPVRTDFDWLSRDPDEVDKYVADPLCGFDTSVQGWLDLFQGLLRIRSSQRQRGIPAQLPIYIFSGAADPVGDHGKGPKRLAKQYAAAGLKRVTLKLYASARHELFNETNRDQVTQDLIDWLGSSLPSVP
ncbi:MAG TPA: alpha/beta hydrolase [Polyangiales bacterium]|nr:alpha/beta hydrolase [Polyangiales bacterium]